MGDIVKHVGCEVLQRYACCTCRINILWPAWYRGDLHTTFANVAGRLMSYIEIHVQVTPALQAVVKVLQLKSPLCDVIANN